MSTHRDYYDEPIYFETLELHEGLLVDKRYPSTTPLSPFRTTIPKMLPYTELDREFSKFCLGSVMVKCAFTNDQNTSLSSVGAGSLLTPIINNCDAKVFISTALHNVIKFGCSLVKLEVKFGKTSVAMFVFHGKIVCHGKLLFPLKHNPKEDWAILELLDTNSGYLFEKFTNHPDYNFLPTLVIPRPSKVEKTIREDRYSLALFSLLIHQSGPRIEDVEVLKRQGFNPNNERIENKLLYFLNKKTDSFE